MKKGYLSTYATRSRKFQEGGEMAPPAEQGMEGAAPAGPDPGADQGGERIMQLAEATISGDMQAAQELGTLMAPMIMEQVQAQGGAPGGGAEGPAPAPEGAEPQFSAGGTFQGKYFRSN